VALPESTRPARACKAAHQTAWQLARDGSPPARATPTDPLIIDLDATLETAHSDKEHAAATFKRGFGFHPLCALADHVSAVTLFDDGGVIVSADS